MVSFVCDGECVDAWWDVLVEGGDTTKDQFLVAQDVGRVTWAGAYEERGVTDALGAQDFSSQSPAHLPGKIGFNRFLSHQPLVSSEQSDGSLSHGECV